MLLAVIALVFVADVNAQDMPKMDASPADIALYRPDGRGSTPIAKVVYSRPQKKGREMLGGKIKFGEVWRTGANETTEVKFYKDVTFGGEAVSAGTYSLFTVPNEDSWTVILNSKLDTWGAYEYDKSKDVARVEAPVSATPGEVEAFTITFNGSDMIMAWENTMVKVSVK